MNNNPRLSPNELIYIPLGLMQTFIKDLNIPHSQLIRERNKILSEGYASSLPEVVFDQTLGKYLVVGGYSTYYGYHQLYNSFRLIPCKIYYQLAEDEKYLFTLEWIMNNHVTSWYNRNTILKKLIDNFNYTKKYLATYLNKSPITIQFYLDPPVHVRPHTILMNKEKVINKISLEAFKHNHNKDYLYILVLHFGFNITYDQLKYISWMRANNIRFEDCMLTLEQEHQLIDRALNLKEDFLNDIRALINEMRTQNGDDPIFHFDI